MEQYHWKFDSVQKDWGRERAQNEITRAGFCKSLPTRKKVDNFRNGLGSQKEYTRLNCCQPEKSLDFLHNKGHEEGHFSISWKQVQLQSLFYVDGAFCECKFRVTRHFQIKSTEFYKKKVTKANSLAKWWILETLNLHFIYGYGENWLQLGQKCKQYIFFHCFFQI